MAHFTGAQAFHSQTSEVDSTQHIPLGMRARDKEGNEYIYVDFQAAVFPGEWVVIGPSFAASAMTATSAGAIGVCMGSVSASDRFGWLQIYGINEIAFATSGVTSSGSNRAIIADPSTDVSAIGASTDTTAVTELQILGVKVLAAASTATTNAYTSAADAATVWLNYPTIVSVVG